MCYFESGLRLPLPLVLLFALSLPVDQAAASDTTNSSTTIKAAAISFVPEKLDLAGNTKKLQAMFRKAAAGGAQIAVSPEGALEGYIVNEILSGEISAEQMKDVAITIDDPIIGEFQALAKELHLCMVIGFAERIGADVYNCAAFISHHGAICGKYHKMQLAEGYHDSWWFNRLGKHSRAFDTPFGRCGIMICNDRWNAQLAKIAALDAAQFLVIPSFGSRSNAQDEAVLSRGTENNIPVIEANVGVTLIVDDNKVAAVDRKEEGITYADITIPAARPVNTKKRNRVEREFLNWRETEMRLRYEKTQRKLKKRGDRQ